MSVLFTRRGDPLLGLPPVGTSLNDMTWDEISKISKRGLGSLYFNVGDRKEVPLNGTIGNLSLSGTYYCYIIGIDHNPDIEGGIHFQFGFNALNDGYNIAFVDSAYNTTKTSGTWFNMYNANSNSGGWESSRMRTVICPAFKNTLPSELQTVLKSVTKYTDNKGGSSTKASYVTATTDEIFLLSEWELTGSINASNSAEQNYQKQYEYYSSGNSTSKRLHNSTTTTGHWWLRSVSANTDLHFTYVTTTGSVTSNNAHYSSGFAPAFVI